MFDCNSSVTQLEICCCHSADYRTQSRENQTPCWFVTTLSEASCLLLDPLVKTVPLTSNWYRTDSSSKFDCAEQKTIKKCWPEQLLFIGLNSPRLSWLSDPSNRLKENLTSDGWINTFSGDYWANLSSIPDSLSESFLWLFIYLRKKYERCGLAQWVYDTAPSLCLPAVSKLGELILFQLWGNSHPCFQGMLLL